MRIDLHDREHVTQNLLLGFGSIRVAVEAAAAFIGDADAPDRFSGVSATQSKGARLYLQPAEYRNGKLERRALWIIRDGGRKIGTGCAAK